jgi:hypothetical protein
MSSPQPVSLTSAHVCICSRRSLNGRELTSSPPTENLLWFENAQHSYIPKRLRKSFPVGARILVNCKVFATNPAVIQLLWIFHGHRVASGQWKVMPMNTGEHTLLSILFGFFCTYGFALRKHACQVLLFWDWYPIFWLGSSSLHSSPSISVRKDACQVIFSW